MTNTNNLTFNTNKQDQIYDRDEGAYEVANNYNTPGKLDQKIVANKIE